MFYKKLFLQARPLGLACLFWAFAPSLFNSVANAQCQAFFSYCPSSTVVKDCDNSGREALTWLEPIAGATEGCLDFSLTQIEGPALGEMVPAPGEYAIAYLARAVDASTGKVSKAACHFNVQVISDTEPPVFTYCPDNITLYAGDNNTATGMWPTPTATDNCGFVKFKPIEFPCPHEFELGQHTIRYVAQDAAGNASVCEFTVTVLPGLAKLEGYTVNRQHILKALKQNAKVNIKPDIMLMPNPFKDWLVVNAKKALNIGLFVQVFDYQGRVMASQTWSEGSDQVVLPAENFAPGVYIIKAVSLDGTFSTVLRGVKI
jgi:hypothetical protein